MEEPETASFFSPESPMLFSLTSSPHPTPAFFFNKEKQIPLWDSSLGVPQISAVRTTDLGPVEM